jgi:hypothetical protein
MQKIPQSVLKRLRDTAAVPANSHPDADLLTAFAERSLADRERGLVVEHLAACGDCREVVTLALPELETISESTVEKSPGPGWFAWPVVRWGAFAAAVLVVVSVGVLRYTHQRPEQTVAVVRMQERAPELPKAAESSLPAARIGQPAASFGQTSPRQMEARKDAARSVPELMHAPQLQNHRAFASSNSGDQVAGIGSASAARIGSGSGANSTSDQNAAAAGQLTIQAKKFAPEIRQEVAVGRTSETVEVQAGAGRVNTEAGAVDSAENQVAQNQANLPLQGRNVTSLDVVKAKDPVTAAAGPASTAAPMAPPGMPLQTSPALMLRASPRWSISAAGVLRRSFDGGKTWENIIPNGAEKQQAQDAKIAPAGPVFRAVSANGLEIWVGGSASTLFHSADGGNLWTRVAPAEGGTMLTGDILSIEFSDAQHGNITTSTAESWGTSDSGQTWRKQ